MFSTAPQSLKPLFIEESFVSPWFDDGYPRESQPDSTFHERYDSFRQKIRFPVRGPSDRCDAYRVSSGMVMLIVDVACSEPFECRLSGQDIVEFHHRLSGSMEIAGKWGELRVHDPSFLIWYQPNGCDDAAEQLGARHDNRETWISLYCDRTWLFEHAGPYAPELLESLESITSMESDAPHFQVRPRRLDTNRVLGDLLRTRGDSALDWWYTTSKAIELLCVTLKGAQSDQIPCAHLRRISDNDTRLLGQARDLLEAKLATPPSLGALARLVGTNPTKLCWLFRQSFGESVYEYLRRRRLEIAHELLTGSEMQIQQVARAVGYRHHSTFSAAFARHFGVAPKQITPEGQGLPPRRDVKRRNHSTSGRVR